LEGSNNDDLGTVTAQQQQQQQEQAIDLIRLRDSVSESLHWSPPKDDNKDCWFKLARWEIYIIQFSKHLRDVQQIIRSTDQHFQRKIDSIHVHPWILFLLEKSEQSSSVLLLFLIVESIAHPPGVDSPLSELQINKTHTTTKKFSYYQETKKTNKNQKTKTVFSLLNFFPYKTKKKTNYLVSKKIKLSWTTRTGNPSSAIHYLWRWLRLLCFVLFCFF
jgi:hypothetical protein